jgi:hypothetical protein
MDIGVLPSLSRRQVNYYRLAGKTPVPCELADLPFLPARVAHDEVGDVSVSTALLETDGRFETLVMGGPLDLDCERYSTWEQAEEGHARWVEKVKEAAGE